MKAELNGSPRCFTGYPKGKTLAAMHASADLFVFPSTTATFGNVILEAQASGLPVLVSDKGGPCENFIANQSGLICRADDSESLFNAMRTLFQNPDRLKKMD